MALLDRVENFRDVGGHRTTDGRRMRRGCVFRSGHLADATDGDLDQLHALGVRTVIDLRNAGDCEVHGESRLPKGAVLVRLPDGLADMVKGIYDLIENGTREEIERAFPAGSALELAVAGAVEWSHDEPKRQRLAEVIRCVLRTPEATLFHCSAGKDRTGFTAAVMQWACGVPDETIVEDYLRSNTERRASNDVILHSLRARNVPSELIEPLIIQRRELMTAFLEATRTRWGDIDGYLGAGLGLGEDEIVALRTRLIE